MSSSEQGVGAGRWLGDLAGATTPGDGGGRAGPEPTLGAKGAAGWPVGTDWAGWGSEQNGNPALPPLAHPGCCQAFIWECLNERRPPGMGWAGGNWQAVWGFGNLGVSCSPRRCHPTSPPPPGEWEGAGVQVGSGGGGWSHSPSHRCFQRLTSLNDFLAAVLPGDLLA